MDPLTSDFSWFTPYQFAGNTPIRALDLDGLEILDYRANFSLNYSKTLVHTAYFAEVQNKLKASQHTGINLKSRMLKVESRELFEGQFLIKEAQKPQSFITESPSIWNDKRVDFGPADNSADKFMKFNNNPKPGRKDAIGSTIVAIAKWLHGDVINGERNAVFSEVSQQINALNKALFLAESAIEGTDDNVMNDNYKFFDISEEQFKVDLTNFIFDGSSPNFNEDYDSFIKSQGGKILDASKIEQKRERIIE